jgi:hypothetical protein
VLLFVRCACAVVNNVAVTYVHSSAHSRARVSQIVGTDGPVLRSLGGSGGLKRHKNFWSYYRIMFMLAYEGVWHARQVSSE